MMDLLTVNMLVLFSIACSLILILKSSSKPRKSSPKLPPGPYGYPILGNILEVGFTPHKSLTKLSKKYGPIMSLKLGSLTTIVVSSPEIAKQVLQTNDIACCNRSVRAATHALDHHKHSVVFLPVDALWRKERKICKERMFSVTSLDATRGLRREKLQKLSDYLKECSRTGQAVDIGDAAFATSLNLLSATLFSKELASYTSGSTQEMKDVVWGLFKCFGKPNLSDYFPILKPFDFQGILHEMETWFRKFYVIVEDIIDERLKARAIGVKNDKSNVVEALLDIYQKDELSKEDIIHLLLDLFLAGSDTTSGTVDWAMSELLSDPNKMSILKSEIRDVVGENGQVEESDISRLPYLQAVIKETFRFHPLAPFLVPHEARTTIEINGYTIPENAQILVNVYASGRDPAIWANADKFMPERFLEDGLKGIDFRGSDFELIPFGAGRRICPALPLADRMVHLMLATFVHNFDWKLENGMAPEEIDMDDKFGLSLPRAVSIRAVPVLIN